MTVSVESEPTHRPGSWRELRELNVLETVDSCIFSKNTLYCRVPFWDIFHSVRWKRVLPHFLRLFCIF